ncbi:MAG: single-stranded DNA-binding protein [Oscillospiraceae bacterium]|nr:single-stranded DNA-binding protein [Oscillospiraceae bacterium]
MENTANRVQLHGIPVEQPRFSHFGGDESFYIFALDVPRLSGVSDIINVVASKSDISALESCDFMRHDIDIEGELRSFNNTSGIGNRLVITVLAKKLAFSQSPDKNSVFLTGAICKKPNLRQTPLGSTICDLMLAVPRRSGRADYLPCIAWGDVAQSAAALSAGDAVTLEGRIQSRKYAKTEPDGTSSEHTAFEVSIKTREREGERPLTPPA